jgi:hypothetical protein
MHLLLGRFEMIFVHHLNLLQLLGVRVWNRPILGEFFESVDFVFDGSPVAFTGSVLLEFGSGVTRSVSDDDLLLLLCRELG